MTDANMRTRPHSLGEAIHHLGRQWGSFLTLGVLSALLGTLALVLVVSATIASVVMLGSFMALIGVAEIVTGLRARTWGRFFLWILAGLLYLAAGIAAIAQPMLAAAIFTLLLGASLVATGLVRLWIALAMPTGQPRGFGLLSGAVTTLLGAMIVTSWPTNSLFILGMLLGVDLIFYGWSWIGFAMFLRRFGRTPGA